jgi:secretion/DNA translocation related CpaE-like protein
MLGLCAVRRRSAGLLIDGDSLGGGVDLVLGREHVAGARWPEFVGLRGRLNAATLHESLPRVSGPGRSSHELAVLSWHRAATGVIPETVPAPAMRSVLESAVRGFDLVVVDLPRQVDEASAEALRAADAALLVVPLEVRAAAAAARVAAALRPHTGDLRMVARGPAPGGLAAQDVAAALDLPLSGEFTTDRRLATALENGELPAASRRRGPLVALCGRLLAEFGIGAVERAA